MCSFRTTYGLIAVGLAALGTACASDADKEISSLNAGFCISGVSWWGTFEGDPESVVLRGCIDDLCRTRTVLVAPLNAGCGDAGGPTWVGQVGTFACSAMYSMDPPVVEMVFRLTFTASSDDQLQDGDVGTLTVSDGADGETLYERTDIMQYTRGDDEFGMPSSCASTYHTFGEIQLD